jgi:hypothetical protein
MPSAIAAIALWSRRMLLLLPSCCCCFSTTRGGSRQNPAGPRPSRSPFLLSQADLAQLSCSALPLLPLLLLLLLQVWRQQQSQRWIDNPLIAQDCNMLSADCIDLLDKMFELNEHQR